MLDIFEQDFQNENIEENIFFPIDRFRPRVFSLSLEFAPKHRIADLKFTIFFKTPK